MRIVVTASFVLYMLFLSIVQADPDPAKGIILKGYGTGVPCANHADWGPAYVPGMEFGSPSEIVNHAYDLAEQFLAHQPFAKLYAKRACAYYGELGEAQFALLSDSTGKTRGFVHVDLATEKCTWRGQRE